MKTSSKTRVRFMTAKDGSLRGAVLFCVLNPVPASRPRVTRWGVHYLKTYKTWMAAAKRLIPEAKHTFDCHVHVDVEINVSKPRTSKLLTPRGDIDNYLKAILDALTKKGYWTDDVLVTSLQARKSFIPYEEEGHFTVRITPA